MCYNGKRGKKFWIKAAIFAPLAIAAGVYIFGSVVMLLWNGILPDLFGFGTITFWQALGILVLSKILFGGFGGRCRHGHSGRHKNDKWMHLNPEEREKMKTEWRSRCQTEEKVV
ncbi:MAG: hypothetical protein HQ522_19810 [Bacteroidetes bacterium]|nr:hypothetical protein [Bacteroidota bacterium]